MARWQGCHQPGLWPSGDVTGDAAYCQLPSNNTRCSDHIQAADLGARVNISNETLVDTDPVGGNLAQCCADHVLG